MLEKIWDRITDTQAPERGITYFAKNTKTKRIAGGRAETIEKMKRVVSNLEGAGYDLYVNVNPSNHSAIKGSRSSVTEWRHIVIDIDPVDAGARPDLMAESICKALDNGACSVIDSGRGYQLWMAIESVRIENDEQADKIEGHTAAFLHHLHTNFSSNGCVVDTSCSDLARVARLAGTSNSKTGRRAQVVYLADKCCPLSYIVSFQRRTVALVSTALVLKEGQDVKLTDVLPHLTNKAADYLVDGMEEPGRHQAAFAAAASLRDIGVPYDAACTFVVRGGLHCRPKLGTSEAVRAVDNAYRKERR